MFFKRGLFFSLLLLTLATRFIGINWGNGSYFHPDENNMAIAVSQLKIDNLDPHFYAYGQFPLYLGFFTLKALSWPASFENSILILRFWSAVFSTLSVVFVYLISRRLLSQRASLAVTLLAVFSPGLIQLAHFGTTESLLILVFLINIYLSFRVYRHPENYTYYLLFGFINGVGIATKISALIFTGPFLLALLSAFFRFHHKLPIILGLILSALVVVATYLCCSPYNFLQFPDFVSSMRYETEVATGRTRVFYTTQFSNTPAYLFQLIHVFPYSSGLPQYLLGILGMLIFLKNGLLSKNKNRRYWFFLVFPSFVYFLYFGQLYVKWTRFVSPLFFLFPVFTVYFIKNFKNSYFRLLLIVISCLPGIYFFQSLYFHPDVRHVATVWMNTHFSDDDQILSEGGNVVDLPLSGHQYQVVNYDFYQYSPNTLAGEIARADYLIIPSRRVFKNYKYGYYQHLFDGSLGFDHLKTFSVNTDIFLNSENAEETWSVFDHPVIRVYHKNSQLTSSQYEDLL